MTGLTIWNQALDLVELVYVFTAGMPRQEPGGLVARMRKASIAIATHMAEGHGSSALLYYLRQLRQARTAMTDLTTCLAIAQRLDWCTEEVAVEIARPLEQLEWQTRRLERHIVAELRKEREQGHQVGRLDGL
jgi:four helix bundle protein